MQSRHPRRDLGFDLLAPPRSSCVEIGRSNRAVTTWWTQLADMVTGAVDKSPAAARTRSFKSMIRQLGGHRLRAGDIAIAPSMSSRSPYIEMRRLDGRRGAADIDEPAIHLAIGRRPVDRRDRDLEGAIIEDRRR